MKNLKLHLLTLFSAFFLCGCLFPPKIAWQEPGDPPEEYGPPPRKEPPPPGGPGENDPAPHKKKAPPQEPDRPQIQKRQAPHERDGKQPAPQEEPQNPGEQPPEGSNPPPQGKIAGERTE